MKRLITLAMLLSLFSCGGNAAKPPVGTPISYEYSYSGTTAYPIQWYRVEVAEDGMLNLCYQADSPVITVYRCPADMLERIGAVASKYKLHKLKSRYTPQFEVLDGYGWHVSINYEEGYISSGGSNAWPESDFWKGISTINQMLESVIESATPADIIGTRER